jgi:hypothetical protein
MQIISTLVAGRLSRQIDLPVTENSLQHRHNQCHDYLMKGGRYDISQLSSQL